MSLKHQALAHCREIIAGKLSALHAKLQDLANSAANETKSSAGDKYETGRAMLHIEQDNVRKQIAGLMGQQAILQSIDPDKKVKLAGTGSLVRTDSVCYFISVALGKMLVNGQAVIALSIMSPLGTKLKGLRAGDSVSMNGQELDIEELC